MVFLNITVAILSSMAIKCSWVLLVQPGQKLFKGKQSIVYCYLEQGFYRDYKEIIVV